VPSSRTLEAVPPLPQHAFMAWCSVKAQGQLYLLSYEWFYLLFYTNTKPSFILRKEIRLKTSGNEVLRRIFRSKREEGTGGYRKVHNEELHNL
jgi:hypothetical protein